MNDEIKVYTLNVNKIAKKDLREIIKYTALNNPMNAINILKKIEDRIRTLNQFPERGGYVPELLNNNIKDYRQLFESPWRIIYKMDKKIVNVLLIIDSRRNTQDILVERLLDQ